ncbi:FAD-dependent oxidoreductase [Aeoliella sp. SH292]|uniref:FAD-dependent oxidoreductase n=1 Tax=Aeoliella sp. SH292 TaxID=3454464 RepID=UPI003F9AEBE9
MRHQRLDCDVLVAGGGMAGVATALAAARRGVRVVLCQDRPVLGGNASSEIRMHIVGADQSGNRGRELETEARESGIIEEIRLENCVRNPQRSPSVFDLILYDKVHAEPNIELLLNTTVTAAEIEGNRITSVTAERQSTEDTFAIHAKVFVDATGDGRLGLEAGAKFVEGRESHAEHGESLAQETSDNMRLGSSIMFQAKKHDRPMPFVAPSWARKFSEDDLRLRPHASTSGYHGDLNLEYGYWWIEWGGHLDTIAENETIRHELLAIVLGAWDHVKNGGEHGAENWALEWLGFLPGKRESRRFVGQYVLTEHDVVQSIPHDDAIAYGGWFIDTHPVMGVDAVDEPPCTQHAVPYLYDIPLRACVSTNVENLMFAGRNISATHIAFASTRVMATCTQIGQGVGTAAAYAVMHERSPHELTLDRQAIQAIQQQLLEDDAYLIEVTNEDPRDLAKQATIAASSEQLAGPAANVVEGPTRSVHGSNGVAAERATPGTHRWMSDPKAGFPAWLQLEWREVITPTRIQLVFDTGLHRVMTLSHADSYTAKMRWGETPPECVTDFRIEVGRNGEWCEVDRVTGNYQRRVVRSLAVGEIDALRLIVDATGGIDHARICEIRVY